MAGFAEILAEVESAPPASSASAPPVLPVEKIVAAHSVATHRDDDRLRSVTAAYREAFAYDPNSDALARVAVVAPPPQELATLFAAEFALARHSPDMLRALRRKMAWRLHPDRAGDTASDAAKTMARFNAMIDTAIARCPRR